MSRRDTKICTNASDMKIKHRDTNIKGHKKCPFSWPLLLRSSGREKEERTLKNTDTKI